MVALVMTFTFTAGSTASDRTAATKPVDAQSQSHAPIPSAATGTPSAKPSPAATAAAKKAAKAKAAKKAADKNAADKKASDKEAADKKASAKGSPGNNAGGNNASDKTSTGKTSGSKSTATTDKATAPSSSPSPSASAGSKRTYPLHTNIVSTTFWVGEIFDANAEDGSQMLSTYDANWFTNFGGCDGISAKGTCTTEKRVASNDYFPSSMTPKQNPFYLDLPYDDINDPIGFKNRGTVIPWANDPGYAGKAKDASISFMKNRWVKLMKDGRTCYGQIADAGPGEYHDAEYVFGKNDARPANSRYGGAGMDVSPALNGCLGFADLNGQGDKVDWQFVEAADVPAGPWKKVHSSDNRVIN